jgi:antitoxin (DNA-binding transcriptional repressor) of toxin-antitoxin stability system
VEKSDNLIRMPDISATEAARRFSDMLDSVEHEKRRYTIIRRGKAVAHLEPVSRGQGSEVKEMLRLHIADDGWAGELTELRGLIEVDNRA